MKKPPHSFSTLPHSPLGSKHPTPGAFYILLLCILSNYRIIFSQIFLGGFLETISLCYITMVMLTVVPITPDAIILLMCSLPMVSAMCQAIKSRSRWNTGAGKLDIIKFGSSAALAVIGIALLLYKVTTKNALLQKIQIDSVNSPY